MITRVKKLINNFTKKTYTHEQRRNENIGKFIDYDGVYGYQCVDMVRQYVFDRY